jgi:hypothetical protein
MHFGFMNVILLHSDHQPVSTTHVVIFRVVSSRIQIYVPVFTTHVALTYLWSLYNNITFIKPNGICRPLMNFKHSFSFLAHNPLLYLFLRNLFHL